MERVVALLSHSHVVDTIFNSISRLQVMHPDPVKDEDEDNTFMTANGVVSVEDHICNLFEKAAVGLHVGMHG